MVFMCGRCLSPNVSGREFVSGCVSPYVSGQWLCPGGVCLQMCPSGVFPPDSFVPDVRAVFVAERVWTGVCLRTRISICVVGGFVHAGFSLDVSGPCL